MSTSGPDLSPLLPGYTVERELGRGAMGVVYLARHESLGRLVAVKELQGLLAADPATRARFVVEAKVMAALDHPHVVPVYDFIERDDRCALVMEQLPGGTVWDRFVEHGVTMPHAAAITLATCSAMQHAHDSGVLHRDVKPENLMFDGAGSMKVTDFGIARVVNGASTKATAAGSVLGTPAYMAPEQAEGKTVGAAVDVYATATMLYEMLSGRLPFERTESLTGMLTQRILNDPIELATVAPHVPAAIADATMRGLVRDVNQRTPTAEAFGREIAEAAAGAWGPSWLDAADIVVDGSDVIQRAARATGPGTAPTDGRSTMTPGTTSPTDPTRASDTVLPNQVSSETDPVAPEDAPASQPAPTSTPNAAPAPNAVPAPAPDVAVKPAATDRDIGRARADQIDQLVDISEILKAPARPVAQYLIAAALFVAGCAWAWLGSGSGTTSVLVEPGSPAANITINGAGLDVQPIELDLTEPIVLGGLPENGAVRYAIDFEQLGAPIGSATSGIADLATPLDTGFLGRITSGALDATITVVDPDGDAIPVEVASFAAAATNPWFLSAAGIISLILTLFAAAGIESYLRAFRRGKGRITTFAGLLTSGALLGGAGAVACTIVFATQRTIVGIAGPAALCAAGAVALGLATRANRKRRRAARQELRHTAIKALAKQ
ncbi:MAG: protein kinase [Ilumatobacter sp.]